MLIANMAPAAGFDTLPPGGMVASQKQIIVITMLPKRE